MSSIATYLPIIQQTIIRYGFPIFLVFGNVGNILSIIIFSQRHHRRNPCSLYLLASTIFGLIGLNWGFGTNLNTLYQSPDPFTVSTVLCRVRGYILQTTSVMYRTMIVLSCMDRFALSSSRVNIRAFSTIKIALIMIGGAISFWMIVSIPQPIFQTIQNNRCYVFGTYGLFFSIYQICLFGVIFPGLMIVFGILLWKNLKTIRSRIHPHHQENDIQQQILPKRDINLMKLVLAEVILAILLTFSYPIDLLYTVLASNIPDKSQERIQIEVFASFIALSVLSYLNYCMTFYVYVITSKSFRRKVKRVLLKCLKRQTQPQINIVSPAMPLANR
jgi:hypothetical protein